MGRKIPKRKHMGIRDPLKQAAEKFKLIKDKINNPPEKRDFQKVSHSLARFMKLKDSAKNQPAPQKGKIKFQRKIIDNEDKPENYQKAAKNNKSKKVTDARNEKEFDSIKQRPNETDHGFMRRVNRVTQESVEEAKFEAKYGVEVVRNPKTGEIKLKKKPRNEIDERLKQNQENAKRVKKGEKAIPQAIVLAPEEKKKLIKAMLAEKKQQQQSEKEEKKIEEFKRDEFKFGEVVSAPPQLTAPRFGQKAETVPRPGGKALLLHSVIDRYSGKDGGEDEDDSAVEPNPSKSPKETKNTKNPQNKAVGTLKGKRKDLSMSMRQMIDKEQDNVVKLYKELKKSQRQQLMKKTK